MLFLLSCCLNFLFLYSLHIWIYQIVLVNPAGLPTKSSTCSGVSQWRVSELGAPEQIDPPLEAGRLGSHLSIRFSVKQMNKGGGLLFEEVAKNEPVCEVFAVLGVRTGAEKTLCWLREILQ